MQKFSINNTELAVFTQGSGPVILFIHGFPFDHSMYMPVCGQLSDEFLCLAPDLRGFGSSKLSLNKEIPQVVSMKQYAQDIEEIVTQLGIKEKIILCGLSMGGYIALQFARFWPERLAGLILCDTRTTIDTEEARSNRLKLAATVFDTGLTPIAESMTPNLLSPVTLAEDGATVDFLKKMIGAQKPDATAAAARGMAEREDSTAVLAALNIPVQIVCGSDDRPAPPEVMKKMAQSAKFAQYNEIQDAGHLPPLEKTDEFVDIVRRFVRSIRK